MGEAIDDASAALIAAMLAEDAEREAFGLGLTEPTRAASGGDWCAPSVISRIL